MPRVAIRDQKQYEKALEVLSQVGGTFQGVGIDEWFLLVTNAQYEALRAANVIAPSDNGAKERPRAKSSQSPADL